MKKICRWLFFLYILLYLSGCVLPAIPLKTGERIRDDRVIMVEPGKTRKGELFEWFGAPTAVAGKDEIIIIPSAKVWLDSSILMGGYYKINSDTFFDLFSTDYELSEYHRVYYYHYIVSNGGVLIAPFVVYQTGGTKTDRLWALVDERTGIVEGYVFREAE